MSSITIVGLGNMATAIAGRALAGGNAIEIIGRDPAKTKEAAASLDGATIGTPGAAPAGDIVILAVPYGSAAAVVSEYGDALRGKVIIDITNPVAADLKTLLTPEGSSGAQEIAKAGPADVQVVKAFNTVSSIALAAGRTMDVFLAGDDAQSKALVSAFVESLGLRPLDVGELPLARALENVALVQLGLMVNSVKHFNFSLGISIYS